MTDLKRDVQDNRGLKKRTTARTEAPRVDTERTAGEDRDFDESEVASNQRHGHPREEHRPQLDRPERGD
jgi:hypothetical protein